MANEITGTVTRVTAQGDLISDIANARALDLLGKSDVRVELGEHFTLGVFAPDHGEPESTLIAVLGSSGFVEVGIVGMNAREMLGVGIGETIRIRW